VSVSIKNFRLPMLALFHALGIETSKSAMLERFKAQIYS